VREKQAAGRHHLPSSAYRFPTIGLGLIPQFPILLQGAVPEVRYPKKWQTAQQAKTSAECLWFLGAG